jgi:AraC family transcriptional regulator
MGRQLEGGRFFGRTLRSRSLAGLTLADVLYPADARLPRHSHERAYFCLIRRGAYTEMYGRRNRVCRPMTLAFHPPGEPHAETFARCPVSSFNVEIGAEWLFRTSEFAGPLDQPAEFHGGEVASLGVRLFREFTREEPDSVLSIESLTSEILAAAASFNTISGRAWEPRWLASARELLDARFREPLTLRSIAREAGVHPVYFAAAFRRFHRCSVGEYVRRRRLEFARRQLADPELPLAGIALDAGFADQSHLTRTFKRFTGKTPGEYRTFLRFKTA